MTTYGVLGAFRSLAVRDDMSAWSFGAARGVMYAVYEDGIEIPSVGLSNGRIPSRHSGESSLSANEPRSSEMRMSMGMCSCVCCVAALEEAKIGLIVS